MLPRVNKRGDTNKAVKESDSNKRLAKEEFEEVKMKFTAFSYSVDEGYEIYSTKCFELKKKFLKLQKLFFFLTCACVYLCSRYFYLFSSLFAQKKNKSYEQMLFCNFKDENTKNKISWGWKQKLESSVFVL